MFNVHVQKRLTSTARMALVELWRIWKSRVLPGLLSPDFRDVPPRWMTKGLSLNTLTRWGGSLPWVTRTCQDIAVETAKHTFMMKTAVIWVVIPMLEVIKGIVDRNSLLRFRWDYWYRCHVCPLKIKLQPAAASNKDWNRGKLITWSSKGDQITNH